MSGTSPSVRQHSFNHRDDTHGLNATTGWGTQGGDWSQQTGVIFRYRVLISDTVASTKTSNYTFGLEYQINGTGGFAAVTTTTPVQATNSAQFADDDNVTSSQVTGGSGTFVTGRGDENGSAPSTGNITLGNGNGHTEIEFALLIDAAQVSNGNTIEIRATGTNVAALDYATVTVVEPVAISGIAAQTFTNAASLVNVGPSQITGIAAMTFGLPSEFEGMLGQSLLRFIGSSATLTEYAAAGAVAGTAASIFSNAGTLNAIAFKTGTAALAFTNAGDIDGIGVLAGAGAAAFSNQSAVTAIGTLAGTSAVAFANPSAISSVGVLTGTSLPTFSNASTLSSTGASPITGVAAAAFSNLSQIEGIGTLTGTGLATFANGSAITATGVLSATSAITFANESVIYATGSLAGVAAPTFSNQSAIVGVGASDLTGLSALAFSNGSLLAGIGGIAGVSAVTFSNGSTLIGSGVGSMTGVSGMTFGAPSGIGGMLGQSPLVFIGSSATLTVKLGAIAGTSAMAFANQSTISTTATVGVVALSFASVPNISADAYIVAPISVRFGVSGVVTGVPVNQIAGVSALLFSTGGREIGATGVLAGVAAAAFSNQGQAAIVGSLSGVSASAFVGQSELTVGGTQTAGTAAMAFSNASNVVALAFRAGTAQAAFSNASGIDSVGVRQISGTSAKVFRLQATFLGTELAEKWPPHAGRGKRRKRYVVDIDGVSFEVGSAAEAHDLLEQAKELAERKAPVDLLVVAKKIKRRKLSPKEALKSFPTPRITTPEKSLQQVVREYQQEINEIYLQAARDAEIRELLRRKMREEDEEEALSILMLIA